MVEYEIITREGGDYNCKVVVDGERAELASISLLDCDLEAEYVEPMVEGFEVGSGMTLRIYRGRHDRNNPEARSGVVSSGGDSLGSLGVRFNTMDWDAEIYHLYVDEGYRNKGLAKVLFTIFIGLCEVEGSMDIRMNIGGGSETIGWLSKMGVPRRDCRVAGDNLARVKTTLDSIDKSGLRLEVIGGGY